MDKSYYIFIALILLSINFQFQLALHSSDNKIGQPLFCYGCSALLTELHKTLKSSYGRLSIIKKELQNICNTNNFVVYQFSPPKMVKTCEYILSNYETQLTEASSKYYKKYNTINNAILKEEFCKSIIKACDVIPNGEELMNMETNEDL